MRRLSGAIGLIGVIVVALPAATGSAMAPPARTRIESPHTNQVVGGRSRVRVVVRSRAALTAMRISVNGQNITRYFHGAAGRYRATLWNGHGLYPGLDELTVETDAYADFDFVDFIVARRAPRLVRITGVRTPGDGAPAGAIVETGKDATLQTWVNGHRDDGAFEPQGKHFVGRFGANDWLRPGRNRLVVLAYRTSASGRSAVYAVESRTFWLRPGQLTASAGRDLVVSADEFTVLHASASDLGGRAGAARAISYRWRIVDHPLGSAGTLTDPNSANPGFEASAPGDYLLQATTESPGGAVSFDTTTVAVRADVPPIGWRLLTGFYPRGTISLNGAAVPDTTTCVDPANGLCGLPFITYAILNRQTLERVTSGTLYFQAPDLKFLSDLAAQYNRAPTYLMVVTASLNKADDPYWVALLNTLGVAGTSAARDASNRGPVSIVGVPGSAAGSAFVSAPSCGSTYGCVPLEAARMAGYLRLNALSTDGHFEFVPTDQIQFNTDVNPGPGQITMQAGRQTFTRSVPTDGSSGFFVVTLNSQTLLASSQNVYVTNNPDGSENPNVDEQMAATLAGAVSANKSRGDQVVLMQAFGEPHGVNSAWLAAGTAIQQLGGNLQIFVQLNQGSPDEPHQGLYAFVGRAALDAPAAESSQSLTGRDTDGRLQGMLARDRAYQYQPVMAGPPGSINFDLVSIVNRVTAPNGGFPQFTGGEAAAADFLAKDPDIMGVCAASDRNCDVRKTYWQKYTGVSWSTILGSLGSRAKEACAVQAAKADAPFTDAQCEAVRKELELEVSRRNRVEAYFGPSGLQAPFLGGVQIPALVDIAAIADEIERDVKPPAADNSTSHALNVVNFLLKIAGAAGGVINPAVATAANGVAAAFGLAAYLTQDNGSPDLVGPALKTKASQLGADLTNRYQDASSYFTTEAQIIMSDWTKMSQVAALATSDPKWDLGDIRTTTSKIALATRQAIYQALVPVAYPVLYDLGTGVKDARTWQCVGDDTGLYYDKRLFQNTAPGAQVTWTRTDGSYAGESHLLALGTRHAVGTLHSAYIPAPPESLVGPLFRDPASLQGGIGLYKLQFYSPQNFELFPKVFQQRAGRTSIRSAYGYFTCDRMPDPPGNGR